VRLYAQGRFVSHIVEIDLLASRAVLVVVRSASATLVAKRDQAISIIMVTSKLS
jgi:hypothetical protein